MLTGELRNRINAIWDVIYAGGISNPMTVVEQLTYLFFMKRLDTEHTREEAKAATLKKEMERRIFPKGKDKSGTPYEQYRWSKFKNLDPSSMFKLVSTQVFPWLQTLGGEASTYAEYMKDARFQFPTPALFAKVVDMVSELPLDDKDTKGDLYEYMLGKLAAAGQNGQFRTPRHIIRLMVDLVAPTPKDIIVDPACGTCGFLVGAAEYLKKTHPALFKDSSLKKHFHENMFHGFDFDPTMLRIGSMNMMLHGIENPDVHYRDSLSQDHADAVERYTLVLANPPFAGSLDAEGVAKDLQQVVKTRKTELLFLALVLKMLKSGGRAAVIVPEGVLFGSSKAHQQIRKMLVEEQKLDAVISLPSGVFKPYAGVSTAIIIFTKTNSGGTDHVWFYDLEADGWSLDDKRQPLLPDEKLGQKPKAKLSEEEHAKNNLPDVLQRWAQRTKAERKNPHSAQSFTVAMADIVAKDYALNLNAYRETVAQEKCLRPPREILKELVADEESIQNDLASLLTEVK
ncbi:type I restriction-modification system subunit M [Myxococcus sp. K38C18041901]|uniref:type I restriction-modification system subunit M n=1 Tax=Myxococcus guangdongensis TaxID=2906760 RepID=UPI0020A7B3D6|nr:class I SAM-dependent DNA methyltransferase [Myxococcus guangdongensis]MCP3065416.1 type I restriction-modification system subunit M [Myxococcus guangdongensis]